MKKNNCDISTNDPIFLHLQKLKRDTPSYCIGYIAFSNNRCFLITKVFHRGIPAHAMSVVIDLNGANSRIRCIVFRSIRETAICRADTVSRASPKTPLNWERHRRKCRRAKNRVTTFVRRSCLDRSATQASETGR